MLTQKPDAMNKILIAFDGHHFSQGAFDMACFLHQQEASLVTGVFLSPIDYREVIGYSGMGIGAPVIMPMIEPEEDAILKNIAHFEEECKKFNIEYRIHKDTKVFALSELATETRFADLLILSSELFYQNIDKNQPNDYLKKTLHHAECPVLLVPEQFASPKSLIIAYDGKGSSVFAIKQFSYLFPTLKKLKTLVVSFEPEGSDVPRKEYITELASRHYPDLSFQTFDIQAKEFATWVSEKKDTMLITGAFGRGELPSLFRKSFATQIIQEHRIPLFIAHR